MPSDRTLLRQRRRHNRFDPLVRIPLWLDARRCAAAGVPDVGGASNGGGRVAVLTPRLAEVVARSNRHAHDEAIGWRHRVTEAWQSLQKLLDGKERSAQEAEAIRRVHGTEPADPVVGDRLRRLEKKQTAAADALPALVAVINSGFLDAQLHANRAFDHAEIMTARYWSTLRRLHRDGAALSDVPPSIERPLWLLETDGVSVLEAWNRSPLHEFPHPDPIED